MTKRKGSAGDIRDIVRDRAQKGRVVLSKLDGERVVEEIDKLRAEKPRYVDAPFRGRTLYDGPPADDTIV